MKPSIGRIVHVYLHDGGPFAAIVVGVRGDTGIDVRVFRADADVPAVASIAAHESNRAELRSEWYWCWPPRV